MTCEIIRANVAGKCHCGVEMEGDVHLLKIDGVPANLVCRAHCPCCTPKMEPWKSAAETIRGEQENLWSN